MEAEGSQCEGGEAACALESKRLLGKNDKVEGKGECVAREEDVAKVSEITEGCKKSVEELSKEGDTKAVVTENREDSSLSCKEASAQSTKGQSQKVQEQPMEIDQTDEVSEVSFTATNVNALSDATTSQDYSPTSSNENESSRSPSDQNKIKRSMSTGQVNGDSGISMEKSGNSSDEDSSKRQKLNETARDRETTEGGSRVEDMPKFHKLKSEVKKRNYRNRRNTTSDTGDNESDTTVDEPMPETGQEASNSPSLCSTPDRERDAIIPDSDNPDQDEEEGGEYDSNEFTTASEDELEEEDEDIPVCLQKEKPKPKWFIIPEIVNREIGSNPLFQRKFYGSLHVVERLELMYKLNEHHRGCVNALNFNQKGNLLASGSDDLTVVIWDWAVGKKHHSFDSGHKSNLFQAKWLPFDEECLMATCARDGHVRLMDVRRGTSRRLATHHGPSHKLAVHPETPHVIISVGEDARVFSIDIREDKPTKLLVVQDEISNVHLYTVHSNPLNSNEFVIGGRSQIIRIYDRRKVSAPLYQLCPENLSENSDAHVTCAVYNYNGTEILASYNDEDIYLFDTITPQIGEYAHKYQGHRNTATVKGVNFFGPKSEFIISGSDCGNIFIWDKNTEAVVQWMPGDEQGVVNCLEPHPHIPILATSGLDYDVKIWVPSCEQAPTFKNLEKCVRNNIKSREQDGTSNPDAFDGQMLWILLRHIRYTERVRNLNRSRSRDRNRDEDEDDDDDDGENSVNDNDSSEHSDSQSEGDGRLQCPPS